MESDGLRLLRQAILSLVDLPDEQWQVVAPRLRIRCFEAGQYLWRAGTHVEAFYFVTRGLVRLFFSTDEGKEFNKSFRKEGDFVGAFSVDERGGVVFSAQCLETTDAVVLPVAVLDEFSRRDGVWQQLGRLQAERVAAEKARREASFLLESAQVRYETFLRDHADLAARLPQYHIASYLGITDVALSRIRKKMRGS